MMISLTETLAIAVIMGLFFLQILLYLIKRQSKNDLALMPNMEAEAKEQHIKVINSIESVSFWILILIIVLAFYIIMF